MKRSAVWTVIRLLPFVLILIFMIARIGQGSVQYSTISDFVYDTFEMTIQFRVPWIYNAFENVFTTLGTGWELNTGLQTVLNLTSYEITVLFIQILFETIAFIPKFVIKVMNKEKEKYRK